MSLYVYIIILITGTIQRAHVNYTTDQSDRSLIMISPSDVFKLNRLYEAVGWYL